MRIYVTVALLLWVTACGPNAKDSFPGLLDRVTEYYRYEQNQQWDLAYKLRTPAFRKAFPLTSYVKQMRRDSSGWKLETFSVQGMKRMDGKVQVSMRFVELAPPSFAPDYGTTEAKDPLKLSLAVPSIWRQVDGKWYCYDAASRMHLSANNPVVPE